MKGGNQSYPSTYRLEAEEDNSQVQHLQVRLAEQEESLQKLKKEADFFKKQAEYSYKKA